MADATINNTGSLIVPDGTEMAPIETVGGVTGHTSLQAIANLAGAGLTTATVTLSNAQLATLFSAPTQIVAAPGVGKALIPVVWTFANHYVSGAQVIADGGGSDMGGYYGTPVAAHAASASLDINFMGSATTPTSPIASPMPSPTSRTASENAALVAACRTANPVGICGIATASVNAGGTGYAANDTGTVDVDVYGGGATYHVTAVNTGAVTAFTITAPGDGYSPLDNPMATTPGGAQPGSGSGFTMDVLTSVTPTSTLDVTVIYYVLTL